MISSARTELMLQPPPIKNVMYFPPMMNDGVVRVPCSPSPCPYPAGADFEGRLSYPPIHQFPCWLACCPLLRAVGLSPYVGWLSNAEPVLCQPSIPSSKSNTQLSLEISVFEISVVKPSPRNPVEKRIIKPDLWKARRADVSRFRKAVQPRTCTAQFQRLKIKQKWKKKLSILLKSEFLVLTEGNKGKSFRFRMLFSARRSSVWNRALFKFKHNLKIFKT